jgi:hydroxymethylpyrimidine pyrophosphatase-like HAD family hydrolase
VKFAALALDYDGTIATDGAMIPAVRDAIGVVRRRGVVVVLVTGRRMEDLRRVAGDLTCFDVVVAENGAVLVFPEGGRDVRVARPPNQRFMDALRNRGVNTSVGEVVVETGAESAAAVLEVIRELELPLILAFEALRSPGAARP